MLKPLLIKKDYLLVIATLVLLLLSYKFAFKETLATWNINSQLKSKVSQNLNLSYQPEYLKRKNNNLDKVLYLYKADTVIYRNNSIRTISAIAENENVIISDVPLQDPVYRTENFIIQKLSLEGSFFDLTKVLFQLQQANSIGMIRSLSFKLIDNRISYNRKLILEIYLEVAK